MEAESNAPTISLITCTYNAAQTLPLTLDSVARQNYGHVEHLIIDGQSSDSTMAIARAYADEMAARGRRVVAKSEPDGGLYDAMNKGLRMAGGDYIVFLNAGDRLHSPDTLAEIVQTAARAGGDNAGKQPGVVYGQTDIIDAEGHFLRQRRLKVPEKLTWKSFRMGMLVCHQAFYARTDLAKRTAYDTSLKFSADVDWCIRVMKECGREGLALAYTGTVVADFMDGGMTSANHKASLRERFRVMRRHYGLCRTVLSHLWFALRAATKGSKA